MIVGLVPPGATALQAPTSGQQAHAPCHWLCWSLFLVAPFLPSLGKIEVIILLQQEKAQGAAPFLVCSDNSPQKALD